jgi:L-threonylcarbamoyladenylate synthase
MKTLVTNFKDKRVIKAILNNEVAAFPTETVYGLGVIYNSQDAFNKLVDTKKRHPDKPFTLMLGDKEQIHKYATFSHKTKRLIDAFLPGEITLLLKPKKGLYPWVTLGSKYIGIRVPNSKDVCDLINEVGEPMLVSSANISSEPVRENFDEVFDTFNDKIAIIIKGDVVSKTPSTIVICDEELTLVREGKLPFSIIKEEWEKE